MNQGILFTLTAGKIIIRKSYLIFANQKKNFIALFY